MKPCKAELLIEASVEEMNEGKTILSFMGYKCYYFSLEIRIPVFYWGQAPKPPKMCLYLGRAYSVHPAGAVR